MSLVTLGPVDFEGFEVPGHINFGGAQKLAIHKLIGGTRIVDVLGRDDAVLSWSGILSGSSAAVRARTLDTLRTEGLPHNLYWDAFCYSVLISGLDLRFCSPWWIPYQIQCVVQLDLSQAAGFDTPTPLSVILADLFSASAFLEPDLASLLTSVPGLLSSGGAGTNLAQSQLNDVQTAVDSSLATQGEALTSTDISQLASATGSIAQLSSTKGYLARLDYNIENQGD